MINFVNLFKLSNEIREDLIYVWSFNFKPDWLELNSALSKIEGWNFENKTKHFVYTYGPNPIETVGIPKGGNSKKERVGTPVLGKIQRSMGLGSIEFNEVMDKALHGYKVSEREIYDLGGITNIKEEPVVENKSEVNWKNQEWYKKYLQTLEEQERVA